MYTVNNQTCVFLFRRMGATTTDFRLLSRCADSRTDFTLAEPNICHTDWFRDGIYSISGGVPVT